jgi:aspartyl-tRNA(Asn)/glutamyl-tRNA(Gln) amidotransferase subunit C
MWLKYLVNQTRWKAGPENQKRALLHIVIIECTIKLKLYQPRGFWARRKCVKFAAPAQLAPPADGELRYQSALPQLTCAAAIMSKNMSVEQSEIEKIAELARVRIVDSEISEVTSRISSILDMVSQMQAVDTSTVEPMANPLDASQRLRPDTVTEFDRHAEFQHIAPAVEAALYLVPKVLD